MKDLTPLEEYRVQNAKLVSISFYGGDRKYNGVFRVRLKTYRWFTVIATNGGGWDRVSVSPYNHARTPTWEEMCEIKEMFFEDEEEVVEYHPKKSEYVNISKHCLHMWRPKRPVPKPIKPKAVINIDDIIDFIIKARPQTLITENYSISIFEKMQGSGSRAGVTKIIVIDGIDNSWAFERR